MNLNLLDPKNPLALNYRAVIDTPEKAVIYNRLLVLKVVGQLLLLGGLLYLIGR